MTALFGAIGAVAKALNKKPKICYTVPMSLSLLSSDFSLPKTAVLLLAVGTVVCLQYLSRLRHGRWRYAFAVAMGTILAFGLIKAAQVVLGPAVAKQGQVIALGIFFMVVAWRLLFGTWDSRTKAAVLGTFVFWVAVHILARETPDDRIAHLIAIAVAAIPAVVWTWLFLPYHRERLSIVLCMFFAGMLSTIPILFYDALVRFRVELHFFLFRIVPESFSSSAQMFVISHWPGISTLQSSLLSMFVSFLLVGVIEEGSKLWVLWRTGRRSSASIDDVMQMAVIIAIGFAFAENVTNSGYFLSFVREYLLDPQTRDIVAFIGNVAGRSVLTSMVHIVSTGLMGYYVGVALYAGPILQEQQTRGVRLWVIEKLHDLFGIPKQALFRRVKILTGFTIAILLHAMSNFLVSLPDALPGNPRTVGDLLHSGPHSPFHFVALLLFPTLFYVVGGFALLTALFQRKENMKERGHLVEEEAFVAGEANI